MTLEEGAAAAAEKSHTKALARQIAASAAGEGAENADTAQGTEGSEAAGGANSIEEGTHHQSDTLNEGIEGDDTEGAVSDPEASETADLVEGEVEGEVDEEVQPEVDLDALEDALAAAGIDGLPNARDLPPEALPVLAQVAERLTDFLPSVLAREQEAQSAIEQVEAFKQRLNDDPGALMLAIALQRPDITKQFIQTVERMEEDESYKELVKREIAVSAKQAQLSARERREVVSSMQARGQEATKLTRAAARKHGVPVGVAERYVAGIVQAEGASEFDLNSIDGLVAELAVNTAGRKEQTRRRAVSPDVAKKASKAPSKPVEGTSPAGVEPASPGLKSAESPAKRGGIFKGLVRQAVRRHRTGE